MHSPLGASLYVPATHPRLLQVADGHQVPQARSLIFCTEDAVAARDLDAALSNLAAVLGAMARCAPAQRFVRVRNPEVLARVLALPGADKLTGFVLPKTTPASFDRYFRLLHGTPHLIMPTLETTEVFSEDAMLALRARLEAPAVRARILALRIGGNDLLALLGLRRPRSMTIYATALGPVIARLAVTFRPHGFLLTAPVFEHLDLPALLDQEVELDLAHGLTGKTAIHPDQIAAIEAHYQVPQHDLAAARAILAEGGPAVFLLHGSMCEVATHQAWAERVLERADAFGVRHAPPASPALAVVRTPS